MSLFMNGLLLQSKVALLVLFVCVLDLIGGLRLLAYWWFKIISIVSQTSN